MPFKRKSMMLCFNFLSLVDVRLLLWASNAVAFYFSSFILSLFFPLLISGGHLRICQHRCIDGGGHVIWALLVVSCPMTDMPLAFTEAFQLSLALQTAHL